MNKIFKVVWSKTKECYVVVSEVAKNNGGKKKVLASVLAGLAMVGAGAAGTPVQAVYSDSGSAINISPNAKTGNYAGTNSVVVGYENKTDSDNNNWGRIIYGANNTAAGASTLALGNENEARGAATTAIGVGSKALDKQSVALGNVARATKQGSVAIGSYVNAETTNSGTPTAPVYNSKDVGQYSTAVGSQSWTKGDYSAAYGYQAEATATNAVAIGRVSKATGTSATAVGVNNKAQAQDSSAVGSSNTIEATATQASAFGRENTVNRGATIAAGYKNTADGDRNVAIGNENTTKGEETIGIGTKVIAGTGKTIAIGSVYNPGGGVEKQTIARGDDTINPATGQVNNVFALAIGNGAQADGKDNKASGMIAIGQDVLANNNNTIAMGIQAKATGAQAIAFGKVANASGSGAFALGQAANATSHGSIAMGNGAQSTGSGSTALGRTAKATNDGAVALGFSAEATGDGAIAIGGDGKGAAYDATNTTFAGLGEKTTATAKNAIAVGHKATANIEGGVALGSESKTTIAAGVQGYNPASDRTNKYSTQAGAVGTSTLAAVSIGEDSTKTRQLTGLAAGTADTDAVNVAQLKNVNLKYAGDTGNSDVLLKDGTLKVKGDNNFISTSADGTGITVTAKIGNPITANAAGKAEAPATNGLATTTNVADAINASGWNVVSSNNGGSVTGTQATKLVNPGNTVTLSAGKNIVLNQNDKQFTYSLNKDVDLTNAGSLTIGDTNVTNGGLTITGGPSVTKTGIDAGSKVISNVADGAVNSTSKDAVNGSQLHTVASKERHIKPGTYTVTGDTVTLNYVDGEGKDDTSITAKITGIANTDLSNISTNGETKIKNLAKSAIDMEDGKNTKASNRDVNGVKTFKVDVEGDLTGITSITNAGPTKMEIGPNSINITGGTLNMGGNKITNVGPATSGTDAVNYDQLKNSRTVVTSKDGSVTVTPTTNGDKTTYDLHVTAGAAASSWNIASDKVSATEGTVATGSAASQNIKDTKTVTMQAGKNLTVKQTNDGNGNASVAFALDKDLKDLTSVTTDKVTTKEIGLQDAAGNTTTIKKDGDRITYSNDGGTTTKTVATLDDEKHIKPGSYAVQNDGSVTMTYVDGNGNPVANTEAKITGIAKQDLSNINDAGKNVITGLGTIVKAGDNVTVSEASDATTGQKTYTVNAVTPAVYTKADGTKVVKRPNGTYTTNLDGSAGNDVAASDVIISFQDAAGDTKNATSIVNNVGSAIKNQTGGDFLTKLDNANTATPNAAVNVSDLKNTADGLTNKGLKFDANSGGVKTNKLGSTVKVQGAGTSADANYSGANIKTFIDQDTAGNTTIDVKLDKNLTGINSITGDTNSGKLVFQDPAATGNNGDAFKFTGGNINAGGNNITNLKSGIVNNNANDDTNAANIGDVKTIAKDTDLHIAPTESNRTGEHIAGGATGNTAAGAAANAYKYDATTKQVVLEYNDGNGTNKTGTKAVIDLSNLPTGGDMSSFKVTSSAESTTVGTHAGDASQEIKNGKSVDFQAGKNMTVKQTNDTNGNTTINYALDKNLDVESVHVGKDGKDGKIGIDGANGTNGINGTTRVDIKVEKGVDGINGANGTDGISRIVYEDKTGTHTVATMDDGLKFTGNNESTENKHKLGTVVKVKGEGVTEAQANAFTSAAGNIAVVADGTDTLTVKLNKNLASINKISNGNSSITLNDTPNATTPAVTITGGNLSLGDGTTNNKIVNVAPGTDDSDAVNYKQLKSAKTEVKAGKNVVVTSDTTAADGHTTYTVNASTPAVYTKPDGTKLVKQPDGTFKDENGNAYTGRVIASFEDSTGATTGGNMIVNNVGSAIKNLGSTGDNYLTKLDLANTATPNAAVNVSDLKNTADALKSNELHIRPTTSGRTGETVNQGAAGTAESYKYDATTKSVTLKYNDGTGAGVTGTEAKIDLSDLANQITSGYTFKANATANGGTVANDATTPAVATTVENGGTINYAAGKNLTVKQDINATAKTHTYTYSLNKDLTNLDKVVVNGENGTNGKDGVTIIGPQGATGATGMPGTNGIDGKVGIAGKDGKDAVSISGKDGIGTIGLTGPQGPAGADGRGVDITTDHGTQTLNKPEANNGGKSERIVYVPKDKDGNPLKDDAGNTIKREVATMDDGLKFTGNNESTENKHKLGSLVKVKGEGVTEAQANAFTSAAGNIAVVADGTDTLTVKLNKNIKGLDSVQTKTVVLGDPSVTNGTTNITYNPTEKRIEYVTPDAAGTGTTTNKVANLADELHIQDTTYTIGDTTKRATAAKDEVTLTYKDGNGNEVADKYAIIKGVANSDLSNISDAGKKNITKLGSIVKAGDNVTVSEASDATTGQKTYTVNAVTPAVYTKADGTKVIKRPDGTFTTNVDGAPGNDVPASDVIVSFQDAAGNRTGGNSIVNNVGSAIDKPGTATGNTFLTQLDNAATTTPFAAVNVRDLKTTADALKANERHIAPTTVATGSTETKGGTVNAAGTANVYKYDAASKTVTLTYNDGNGNAVTDTKAVIDLSNLSTGGTGASSWNIASDKVSATEGAVATGSAGTQNIADGKTVTMKAGKNLTVNQTNDGAGNASVAFSLDKNLENLDKVVVNGNDGATGQAGVSIVGPKGANGVDGNDGKVGIAGKDGKDAVSISGKDGVGHIGLQGPKGTPGTPGADGASLDITTDHGTQTLVKPEANNNNKSERIVYVPKDASGNPLKDTDGNDIKREVATMDDGLKFTGNNTATENKHKLGSLVKVQGEGVTATDEAAFQSASGNIAVTADGTDTLTIRLNKNLKGLNSIQLGGNTIQSNGDNITFTTNGGTTKTVATTDQLWTIQANGTDVPAKSGKVNLVAGDHITITPDAANGKMTISATGFGSMDGFNVKTSAESATVGTHAGDTTENIKNGKTVDMQAGKNLVVTQTNDGNGNTTVNYALNKDVDLGTNGSLKTGDTTINNDGFKNGNTTVGGNGMTIKNPTDPTKTVSLTKDGLNNGGNQITNVASGGNVDTNAANIGDIKRLAKDTRIKDGTYTVDNNGTVELTYVDGAGNQVKDASGNAITAKITGLTTLDSTRVNVAVDKTGSGKVVGATTPVKVTKGTEFVAGDNLIVERKARTGNDLDNSVVYSLNSNLTGINSISNTSTGPKMTFGGNSINVTNGDLNMGGNKITNLGKGTATTDAATVGQLTKVTSNNHSVVINKTTDANGAPVYDLAVTGTPGAPAADPRVDMLGEEIGRVGAQGAALSALKPIQYDPLEPTQIMAGYGNYRGNSAVALGVAHYKNESTLIHGGVSWAGGSSHMMANAGVTWKVGNRDSEAAVADRYRKGPISSAYAMQQEMAAMKAQNAGLKGEVSDLKAENEQMKAQIAAMMAKLGL